MDFSHFFATCTLIVLLLLAVDLLFLYRVLRPLRKLSLQIHKLANGDFSALDETSGGIKEIEQLRHSMATMVSHVRRAQKQNFAYTDVLIDGQEKERARLARELHDETVQSLIAISQNIDIARKYLESDKEMASTSLQSAREQAVASVFELRNLIGDLRPPALEELGLITALKMQQTNVTDVNIRIQVKGVERRLLQSLELTLFRCAQEAVSNARRHATTDHIDIWVEYARGYIEMNIMDDGDGFVVPEQITDLIDGCHYGLVGIHERVQHLGGRVNIFSRPNQGTTITIRIPQLDEPQPESTVCDPVCSVTIRPHQAYSNVVHAGERYYFCCPVCQGAFIQNPELYLSS